MIEWPKELVLDIARRRSALFLGAGVSKNAKNKLGERPKDWREFLTSGAALVDTTCRGEIEACIASSDLLTACELLRKNLKTDRFKSLLLTEFVDKGFEPAGIHDDIVKLDSRIVLTTNIDRLYELRANHLMNGTVLVKNYYDQDVADVLRRSQRSVIKVNGTIDTPDKTVFTRMDYAKARNNNGQFYRVLESLLLTHTFAFLGASMSDPDIQLLLENHAYQFAGSRPHYMVMPRNQTPPGVMSVLEESMNLRAIEYDPSSHHIELASSLTDLQQQVGVAREELLRTLDW